MRDDAESFFGGAFAQVESIGKDCKELVTLHWCVHLTVAHKTGCNQGFYIIVKFYDEYGDLIDKVRGRTLGVTEGALVSMTVSTDALTPVKKVAFDSASCIY